MLELVKNRIISLKAVVDQLQLGDDNSQGQQLEANLNQIMLHMTLFENSGQNDEKKRKAISLIREHIQQMNEKLEDLHTWSAQQYRKEIGDNKEAFEQLTDSEQKKTHPAAFKRRSTFHLLIHMKDMLSLLSSVLMDASFELEKRMQAAQPHTESIATPTERYDHDPAPPFVAP
jgi:hypothetical protein